MNDINHKDEKITKAADLLEQIKSVDEMIELHRQKANEGDIMLIQYEYKREKLLNELKEILTALNISPSDLAA